MSQSSYGESPLQIESSHVGLIRVQDLYSGSSVAPRLCFRLGVRLDRPPSLPGHVSSARIPYRIVNWRGELRLTEGGDALAAVSYLGGVRPIRFPEDAHEVQIVFACDIDGRRLEAIERRRAGAPPVLFLELWPEITSVEPFAYVQVAVIRITPPRDKWLAVLDACNGTHHEILEVQLAPGPREHLVRAVQHTRDARRKLLDGHNTEAVAACRKAMEAAAKDVGPSGSDQFWTGHFSRFIGSSKGQAIGQLVAKLKGVANTAHHDSTSGSEFSRSEAFFVVRTTESFLALVAELGNVDQSGAD